MTKTHICRGSPTCRQWGLTIDRCISALFDITVPFFVFPLPPPPQENIFRRPWYADKTLTLRKSILCEQASEREHFHIIKKCYFYQYFVGISEILSVQMIDRSTCHVSLQITCTDRFPNTCTNVNENEKALLGGGGAIHIAPPPSALAGYASTY